MSVSDLETLIAAAERGASTNYALYGFLLPSAIVMRGGRTRVVGFVCSPGGEETDMLAVADAAREAARGADAVVLVISGRADDGAAFAAVVAERAGGVRRNRVARVAGGPVVWRGADGPTIAGVCGLISGPA